MAQPISQALVDPAHPWAGPLWYAHDTGGGGANDAGVWNALTGIMEAKTGPGAVSVEGGANVINSTGTTYLTLASPVSVNNGQTLFLRARMAALNNATMVAGDRTATDNFLWINNGSNQLQFRRSSAGGPTAANTGSNVMRTYHFVFNADGTMTMYVGGASPQTLSGTASTALVIKHLLAGYSGGSFSMSGALECIGVIPVMLSAGEVATHAADLYQTLQAAPAGVMHNLAAAAAAQATAAATLANTSSITITSPKPYQARQRDKLTGRTRLPFTVSLTYTGSPTGFEYRFANGAWAALPGTPSGGAFSTPLHLPIGQGNFEVRFANDTGVSASVPAVTVGPVWVPAGQSNACGRAPSVVAPVAGAAGLAVKLGRDGVWKPLTEANTVVGSFDEGTSAAGSVWGAVTNRLQVKGVPMALIPCAQGSTYLSDWARYDPDPSNAYLLYGDIWQAWLAAGGLEGVLFWQGENEASGGVSQAAYAAPLNTFVNNVWSDFGCGTFIIKIVSWVAGAAAIRAAQDEVIATNPHVVGWADGNQYAGGVHYSTVAEINALADVIAPAMVTAFYDTSLSAVGSAAATGSATLLKGVSLAAASVATAAGGAALSRSVPMGAVGASVAVASGALKLNVVLSGAALAQVTGAATLSMLVNVSATGVAQAAASASLQAGSGASLSTSGSAQATGGATLWLDVPLTATAVAQAQAAGSMSISVPLAANALSQASATASLPGSVVLQAAGAAVAGAGASLQVMGPVVSFARGMVVKTERRSWRVKPESRVNS